MLSWFKSHSLEDVLERTKKIKVRGVRFAIKKIDPINYVDGSKVLLSAYETYQTKPKEKQIVSDSDIAKMKRHYIDCFMASVVSPKLARTEKDEGFLVEKFFTDWSFATALYQEILLLTYGKKKLRELELQGKSLLKST